MSQTESRSRIVEGRFFVFSAGCIRRALDTIHLQRYLLANGWKLTRRMRTADLIVVATCGVVRLNEISSLKGVAEAVRRKRTSARIVVTGCLPVINPDEIRRLGDFVLVPTKQEDKLDVIIQAKIPYAQVSAPDSIADNPDIVNYLVARSFCRSSKTYRWLFHRFSMSGSFLTLSVRIQNAMAHIRSWVTCSPRRKVVPYFNIKIADGCMSDCTFCATRLATGKLRSRPPEAILQEFRNGLSKGYKVFQFISEDTGCYGLDVGTTIGGLLRRVFAIEGEYRLILIDFCPQWLVEQRAELIPILVREQDKMKELFVPVQSGSDRVLNRMKRQYTAEEAKSVFCEIKERAPGIALRTSILVGFPGETDEDFELTKCLIAAVPFDEVTVNRYEDRPGTESSRMTDKVAQDVIEQRARILAEELNCKILS